MVERVSRRGISRYACILLAVCMLTGFGLVGTVSACGGTDSYSSSVLYTNWDWVQDQFYQKKITNPTTCVSGMIIVMTDQSKYLTYSINKYYPKFTEDQKLLTAANLDLGQLWNSIPQQDAILILTYLQRLAEDEFDTKAHEYRHADWSEL